MSKTIKKEKSGATGEPLLFLDTARIAAGNPSLFAKGRWFDHAVASCVCDVLVRNPLTFATQSSLRPAETKVQ